MRATSLNILFLLSVTLSFGQCLIDNTSLTEEGIFPDTVVNVCQNYVDQQIQFSYRDKQNTSIWAGGPIPFNSIRVDSIINLPKGLTIKLDAEDSVFKKKDGWLSLCLTVSGKPESQLLNDTVVIYGMKSYYISRVGVTVSETGNTFKFVLIGDQFGQNGCLFASTDNALHDSNLEIFPNPITNNSTITTSTTVEITIIDVLGKVVHQSTSKHIELNNLKLQTGLYHVITSKGDHKTIIVN